MKKIDISALTSIDEPIVEKEDKTAKFKEYKAQTGNDYILDEADKLMETAGNDPEIKAGVIDRICKLILCYDRTAIHEHYINVLGKKFKPRKQWTDAMKFWKEELRVGEGAQNAPGNDADIDTLEAFGFYTENNKYYFAINNGSFAMGTNFTIKPLFHIINESDNRRLIELTNEFGYNKIVDVPSKTMVSVDQFQQFIYGKGNFLIFISKNQFLKILNYIGEQFPVCVEPKTLGWQPEGFWAFSNGAFNGKWTEVDNMGIVRVNDVNYFLPAFSDVYKDVRSDDDMYESDRFFTRKFSGITFKQWANKMVRVYGDNGQVAIAFLIASLFRSDIYSMYKIFPHLFLFGEKGSGKSQLGWSLSNVFLDGQPPFNLNSGTDVAFFRKLGRFRNIIVWFDEYTNQIDEKRFQAQKSAYDGVGREKGKLTRDSRTEKDPINSALCISGQYLPTRDDNALYTRSIVLTFAKKNYTDDDMKQYNELKQMEELGLSDVVCELLMYREAIVENYAAAFNNVFNRIKTEIKSETEIELDERILRNYCILLTVISVCEKNAQLSLPFKYVKFEQLCKNLIIEQCEKTSGSDALAMFWNIVSFLIDKGSLVKGQDFDFVKKPSVSVVYKTLGVLNRKEIHWDGKSVWLMFMNTQKVHNEYLVEHRRQHGESGLPLSTLMDYIHNHRAYVGLTSKFDFEKYSTSAHVFNMEQLPGCLYDKVEDVKEKPFEALDYKHNDITEVNKLEF